VARIRLEVNAAPGSNNVGKPANSGRGVGKPEHAGMAPNIGKPREDDVGHPANASLHLKTHTESPGVIISPSLGTPPPAFLSSLEALLLLADEQEDVFAVLLDPVFLIDVDRV
jgi:hypothetical protein